MLGYCLSPGHWGIGAGNIYVGVRAGGLKKEVLFLKTLVRVRLGLRECWDVRVGVM